MLRTNGLARDPSRGGLQPKIPRRAARRGPAGRRKSVQRGSTATSRCQPRRFEATRRRPSVRSNSSARSTAACSSRGRRARGGSALVSREGAARGRGDEREREGAHRETLKGPATSEGLDAAVPRFRGVQRSSAARPPCAVARGTRFLSGCTKGADDAELGRRRRLSRAAGFFSSFGTHFLNDIRKTGACAARASSTHMASIGTPLGCGAAGAVQTGILPNRSNQGCQDRP